METKTNSDGYQEVLTDKIKVRKGGNNNAAGKNHS